MKRLGIVPLDVFYHAPEQLALGADPRHFECHVDVYVGTRGKKRNLSPLGTLVFVGGCWNRVLFQSLVVVVKFGFE